MVFLYRNFLQMSVQTFALYIIMLVSIFQTAKSFL